VTAGRNRKAGDRYPSGKLVHHAAPPRQSATFEKRRGLVGGDALDQRAGYPLGILYLRGAIKPVDHAGGMRFAGLYAAVWGNGAIRSHLEAVIHGLRRGVDRDDDPERERRQRRLAGELGEATAVLLALPSRRPYEVLLSMGVFENPLRFMDVTRASSPGARRADQRADQADIDALIVATGALAVLWRI
jgi:hypothetical protein